MPLPNGWDNLPKINPMMRQWEEIKWTDKETVRKEILKRCRYLRRHPDYCPRVMLELPAEHIPGLEELLRGF